MRNVVLVVLCLLMAAPCWAAKIYLNSGSSVEGKVVATAADSLKVDVGGVPVTYYKDEISKVEGDDEAVRALGLTSAAVEEAVSAPAPEAAMDKAMDSAEAPALQQDAAPVAVAAPAMNLAPAPAPAAEAVSAQKKELILKFIDVFGTRQAMLSNFGQMLTALPAEQAEKLRGIFSVDAIIEELVPVYDRHFSEAELSAFINFYSSAEGRKLVSTIPQIMKESVEVSAKYFEARMPEELKNVPAPQTK